MIPLHLLDLPHLLRTIACLTHPLGQFPTAANPVHLYSRVITPQIAHNNLQDSASRLCKTLLGHIRLHRDSWKLQVVVAEGDPSSSKGRGIRTLGAVTSDGSALSTP